MSTPIVENIRIVDVSIDHIIIQRNEEIPREPGGFDAMNYPLIIRPDGTKYYGIPPRNPYGYIYNNHTKSYQPTFPSKIMQCEDKPLCMSELLHDFQRKYSKLGIVLAVILFPIGIVCASAMYDIKCTKCGAIIKPDKDGLYNVWRNQQNGKVNHNINPGPFDR